MNEDSVLRERAREMLQAAVLPPRPPDNIWGGPSAGAACSICGVPLGRDELELEIEFARGGIDDGSDRYHVHIRCFAAWECERRALELAAEASSVSDRSAR
jgi:hypothetical protein